MWHIQCIFIVLKAFIYTNLHTVAAKKIAPVETSKFFLEGSILMTIDKRVFSHIKLILIAFNIISNDLKPLK